MTTPARPDRWRTARVVSAVLLATGLTATVLLVLQPWASCPGIDDAPAGCPVGATQVAWTGASLQLAAAGVLGFVATLVARDGPRRRPAAWALLVCGGGFVAGAGLTSSGLV
ncbi:hypothetical protein GTR02_05095 [Kineococcus sp. R8]|uniref:hypothetical protein n=1 Tax=Kineococcus siccus TaxID=2696567 RepID=UPI0014128128|nr:hypothetical protein [Kineococcus siccus]NAZ81187.1 hypothetical protein [Kineococcus siccus]